MAKTASGKSKKYDRNRKWCQSYALSRTREKNKAKKILRHLRRYDHSKRDLAARQRYKECALKEVPSHI